MNLGEMTDFVKLRYLSVLALLCVSAFGQMQTDRISPKGVTLTTGRLDATAASSTAPVQSGLFASAPATCVAYKDLYLATDKTVGQQLYQCNATGNGWVVLAGGGVISPVLYSTVQDNFNRSGADLGANWTAYLNGWQANNGNATATGGTSKPNLVAYTGVATSAAQTARVVISAFNGTDAMGPAVRISGTPGVSASWYQCTETSAGIAIQKAVGATTSTFGTVTTLATASITAAAGDVITLSVVGNTLSCQRNWTSNPILQVNDASSPLTTGLPGMNAASTTQAASAFAILNNPVLPLSAVANIVFDGDSITAFTGNGSNSTAPYTSFMYLPYANAYAVNLGVSAKCLGVGCSAASSGTMESMLSTGTSVIDPLFVAGKKNIVVLWGGTNDIVLASRTPAQVYTDITTYVAARHAAGWNVIIVPAVSRGATIQPSYDYNMQLLNALISANTAGADAVVTMPCSLVCQGGSANTTLFNTDQVHPTEFSQVTIIAPAVAAAIGKF